MSKQKLRREGSSSDLPEEMCELPQHLVENAPDSQKEKSFLSARYERSAPLLLPEEARTNE